MLNLQHNVVSILYSVKGMVEAHLCRMDEHLFQDKEDALSHAHEILKRIYAQADRALKITKRIQMAMKAEREGDGPLEDISVKEVWNEVIETLDERYLMHGFELVYHIPDDFPRIQCNRKDLLEIFYCLAENAVQAMGGKGKLVIRANLVFRPGDDPLGNIIIADTGPGLPEETLNHLFEPFMTTKELDKGNGLGLCLVKSLVRKNRGSISVSSFHGCGTTFTLTFGVAKAGDHEKAKNLALAG